MIKRLACLIIGLISFTAAFGGKYGSDLSSPDRIRRRLDMLSRAGQYMDVITFLELVEQKYGSLNIDGKLPSLYNHQGVALHNAQRLDDAEQAFLNAVTLHPEELRAWVNLGEARTHQFRMDKAIEAYSKAAFAGETDAQGRLLKAKGWTNSWRDFEELVSMVEKKAKQCHSPSGCVADGNSGLEYTTTPGKIHALLSTVSPSAQPSEYVLPSSQIASFWDMHTPLGRKLIQRNKRLKVGIISSDFGVHPVATLIRGMIQYMDRSKVELYAFAMSEKLSWWGTNITVMAEHFIVLANKNTQDAAREIARHGIEILIDLNGHTLHTGLSVMAHRPSLVQMSFLGFPTTTGASFIDYYIGDPIALPAEHRNHFTEALLLMPTSCIANDYAQIRGNDLLYTGSNRSPRSALKTDVNVEDASILFATFSNYQKISPDIFAVWMSILRQIPGSKMVFIDYSGYEFAIRNLRDEAKGYGVSPDRIALMPQTPWIDHIVAKTAIDMVLDTSIKTGHTTGLDAWWAGVPSVALGGGAMMPARAAESFAEAMNSYTGIAWSLKEYEDIVLSFARDRYRLDIWRRSVERKRVTETLFDTKTMIRLLYAAWEAAHFTATSSSKHKTKYYHVITLPQEKPKLLETHYVDDPQYDSLSIRNRAVEARRHKQDIKSTAALTPPSRSPSSSGGGSSKGKAFYNPPLPKGIFDPEVPLLLNIGGIIRKEGWINVNSQPSSYNRPTGDVDVIRQLHNLEGFPNHSVHAIYCSHALEHVPFGDGTLEQALQEWRRVLMPGGLLLVAVPDLAVLSRMYLDPSLSLSERFMVTKMIYGSQTDEFDYHHVGFNQDLLVYFLTEAGFCDIERVGNFNIVQDTSSMIYHGYAISLNIVARACDIDGVEGTYIEHNADPYVPQF